MAELSELASNVTIGGKSIEEAAQEYGNNGTPANPHVVLRQVPIYAGHTLSGYELVMEDGSSRFRCETCGNMDSKNANGLKIHYGRTHHTKDGAAPQKAKARKSNLRKGRVYKTKVGRFTCVVCAKVLPTKMGLGKHVSQMHGIGSVKEMRRMAREGEIERAVPARKKLQDAPAAPRPASAPAISTNLYTGIAELVAEVVKPYMEPFTPAAQKAILKKAVALLTADE